MDDAKSTSVHIHTARTIASQTISLRCDVAFPSIHASRLQSMLRAGTASILPKFAPLAHLLYHPCNFCYNPPCQHRILSVLTPESSCHLGMTSRNPLTLRSFLSSHSPWFHALLLLSWRLIAYPLLSAQPYRQNELWSRRPGWGIYTHPYFLISNGGYRRNCTIGIMGGVVSFPGVKKGRGVLVEVGVGTREVISWEKGGSGQVGRLY
eukprot:763811-Hanusia_phi.AAC.4